MTVRIGILTRNPSGWGTRELIRACIDEGCQYRILKFQDLSVTISGNEVEIYFRDEDKLNNLVDIVLVRPIGKCSLEQAVFRMDLLHCMHDVGILVVNNPRAIEIAIDKFRTCYMLALHGIKTPLTLVTESEYRVLEQLHRFRSKYIVVKPLFGSRGFGTFRIKSTRRVDSMCDLVWRICFYLTSLQAVLYLQEYLTHEGADYRIFVIGERAVAGMIRKASTTWKTNIAQGGRPVPLEKVPPELEELAVKACKVIGCEIAGVDIVETKSGDLYVLELNSQPGWRGLQSVTKVDIAREIVKYLKDKVRR